MKTTLNSEWPSCDPGTFRHCVTLLQQTITTDISGSVAVFQEGIDPITISARIDFIRGSEIIKSGQDISTTYIKLTSWYRPEFTGGQHLRVNNSHFIIQYAEDVKMLGIFMVLTCIAFGGGI